MLKISFTEAKTKLFQLITTGEEVFITRYGIPVARLIPMRPPDAKRIPGSARGKFKVPPEFFEPLPDDNLESFEKEITK